MTKILVGSKNPVKVDAVRIAFSEYFDHIDVAGIAVDSGVSTQPVEQETFIGAENRALALHQLNEEQALNAQFFVGVEGGILQLNARWFAFGVMCVLDREKRAGFGTSPLFELPEVICEALLKGTELGAVIDQLANDSNTKQKGGAVGFLTRGIVDRKNLYVQGLLVALIPFIQKEIYFDDNSQ